MWLLQLTIPLRVHALLQRGCGSGFRIGVAVGLETLDQQQWYALCVGVRWYLHCICMNVRSMCQVCWVTMHVLCLHVLCCAGDTTVVGSLRTWVS